MRDIQRNGAPDVWWGGRLYEAKQGGDRLSEDQRAWHRHYYAAHGEWPRIAYFPTPGSAAGCIFCSFMEFEQALADGQPLQCQTTPELYAIYRAAYATGAIPRQEECKEVPAEEELTDGQFLAVIANRICGRPRRHSQRKGSKNVRKWLLAYISAIAPVELAGLSGRVGQWPRERNITFW